MDTFFAPATALDIILQKIDGAPAPAFVYRGYAEDATALAAYSFAGIPIGSAAVDRSVKIAVWANSSLAVSMTNLEINGITATAVVPQSGTPNRHLVLYEAVVPTGTSATINVTYSGSALRCAVAVWTSTGYPTTYTARSAATTTVGGVVNSLALPAFTTPVDGFAIVIGWLGSATGGPAVVTQSTGSNTIRVNGQVGASGVWAVATDSLASGSQTFTIDGADAIQYLGAGAAWG